MKHMLSAICITTAAVCIAGTDEFCLKDPKTETVLGPFECKNGEIVQILDYAFEIQTQKPPDEILALQNRLQRIVLPVVEFKETALPDIIHELSVMAKEHDPEKRGCNLILNHDVEAESTNAPPPLRVTLAVRDIPLLDALKMIAECVNYRCILEPNAVRIVPADWPAGPMITRSYPVQPSILDVVVERSEENTPDEFIDTGGEPFIGTPQDIQKFFDAMGVPFPRGAHVEYNRSTSRLIMHNTAENLDLFERILGAPGILLDQVRIETKLYEIADEAILPDFAGAYSAYKEREYELAGKIALVSRNRVVTRSGVNAQADNKACVERPKSRDSIPDATTKEEDQTPIVEIGDILNATPTVGPDGYTVDLTFIWTHRLFKGWIEIPSEGKSEMAPAVSTREITTSVVLGDGDAIVMQVDAGSYGFQGETQAPAPKRRPMYLVVSVRLVDMAGKPIHRDSTGHMRAESDPVKSE